MGGSSYIWRRLCAPPLHGRRYFGLRLEPDLDQAADGLGMAWGIGLFMGPSVDLLAETFGKAQRGRRHLARRGAASLFLSYDN
jgi:hypothetical protein